MDYTYSQIAKMIDHSLLNPTLTVEELEKGCNLALAYDVASVCILPYYLKRCAEILKGSDVRASTTIGFPHGGHTTAIKVAEAAQALKDGGEELDMVVNISKVLSGDWDYVRADIGAVIGVTHAAGQKVKVIFENCYLNDAQKITPVRDLRRAERRLGQDLDRLWHGRRDARRPEADAAARARHVQVKAAGGIRTLDALLAVRELGVTRSGATRTAEMLDECKKRLGLP